MALLEGEVPVSELYDGRMIWMCKNCKWPLSIDSKKPGTLKIVGWGPCMAAKGLLKVGYHKPVWRKYKKHT